MAKREYRAPDGVWIPPVLTPEECCSRLSVYFDGPQRIITLHPFTKTEVNGTAVIAHNNGRASVSVLGAGAATDGQNFCEGVAGRRLKAGKQTRIRCSVTTAHATPTVPAVAFGLNLVSTGIVALMASGGTPSTDYFMLTKRTTEAGMTLKTRKASGTEAATVLTDDTWVVNTYYDYEIVVIPSQSVAGAGQVWVFKAIAGSNIYNLLGGAPIAIASALPDTVSTALFCGFRAGDTGTDVTAFSKIEIEQEG